MTTREDTSKSKGVTEAFLLCGGGSTRLSFPKEMLRVDGDFLAVKLVERLREEFGRVSVVTNTAEYLSWCLDAPLVGDVYPGSGPLAGIHAGLSRSKGEAAFFLACDMPLAHIDMARRIFRAAETSRAEAVVARAGGRPQPLMGVYRRVLVPRLEEVLERGGNLSLHAFLDDSSVEFVDFDDEDARLLQDIDTPADLPLLKRVFAYVEPLPVSVLPMKRLGSEGAELDVVVAEWPVAIYANGIRLATVMCMPTGLREMALGFPRYLGLVESAEEVTSLEVDYRGRRITLELDVEQRRVKSAVQQLITSTCGANVYGAPLENLNSVSDRLFTVSRPHILETIQRLRAMAPVFARTGATHQAAWSDGSKVRFFYEDIGRHNAIDKIVGSAMAAGKSLSSGALMTTGRLNSEMVVKAIRAGVPVLASRSAATTNAVRLSEEYGLTLVGFARAGRVNVYTHPERVIDE